MRHVVFSANIGPTIANSVPGGGIPWEGGYASVDLDNPLVGRWTTIFLMIVLVRLTPRKILKVPFPFISVKNNFESFIKFPFPLIALGFRANP